jgi:hypothetical protein
MRRQYSPLTALPAGTHYSIDKRVMPRYYAQLEKNPLRSTKTPVTLFLYFACTQRLRVATRAQGVLIVVKTG